MAHLWSGRFDNAPDEEVFAFQSSFAFDRRLFEDDVTGSLAWAEALAGAGVLSAATTRRSSTDRTRMSMPSWNGN
jgi:argininosuccinate lyase